MRACCFLACLCLLLAGPAPACGPDSDCVLGERRYRVAMPEGHDAAGLAGAIVFAHGHRGSARGTMRDAGLRRAVSGMGLALVAAESAGEGWDIPGAPGNPDGTGEAEMAYFEAVVADAAARFAIDPGRVMMAGFSAGGMVTWELACRRPGLFAGFAPVAGTFWRGPPGGCAAPASVIHVHGAADRIVPLAGRPVRDTRQGDVRAVLEMYRREGGFGPARTAAAPGGLTCRRRDGAAGDVLEFCTFPGGHSFRPGFLAYAWGRLRAAGKV